jgi:hypothetical protein
MHQLRRPSKVAAIANLIGESGETVKQPLPDFYCANWPFLVDRGNRQSTTLKARIEFASTARLIFCFSSWLASPLSKSSALFVVWALKFSV